MTDDPRPPDLTTRTEGEGETLDMPEGLGTFASGQVLGERYQILEMLGRGGMGEVWHAFDLKLRVEVALKALRQEFFKSERRLELLRQEVRAAREVVSPNVCRIFDLIEVEGRELVSMEYVDGATLLGVLQERGPLELKEAQDIASQFLAGLEAIHKVGLIHRDIKPENIMLTRAGRVVVMDFGLARQETEGGGTVAGTPAYMSPEQAAGQTLDARADVYAAGVVLAEMVSPEGIKSFDSRQSVWEGVRSEPAKVPDSPWAPVIQQAVKKDREGRFNSAHTLTRALEDVTLRVEGADDLHPYPGLASFTEADAEYFFGREAEVEQMWRKLEGPPRMLGLVGPSGAGKSSFIGAGVLANAPSRWDIMVSTPGNAATSSLGRVVARTTGGDPNVAEKMMDFQDPDVAVEVLSHWSRQSERGLLVVDQFEELFTQNSVEEQRCFADLLERLVLEADIHVVLCMRDDFLMQCRDEDSLRPIFADMTALPTLSGAALRRALVQPATKCGYRFEDDALVDEMLAEVQGERGALPLLAFAAARLWERRDKERGLLTREAYHDIGGVAGALAQHAESTIDRIGSERIPIVRELFRNLVTAEGTRAVREWKELLSIFSDSHSESPDQVLRELIDARLLTSYEIHEDEHEPTRRVEIIHESLLANWPRLVRWQTQDADAAQLRDQLRQAARTWDDQGRTDDTLWTGAAYREFVSWRDRYPGGLTETEEAFGSAMTTLAGRRRRRRRFAVTATLLIALAVSAVTTVLWRRSVLQKRRAEAQKLFALGQIELEPDRTASLAYATTSLELAEDPEVRKFAIKALWQGPDRFVIDDQLSWSIPFSRDGQRLVKSMEVESGPHLEVLGPDGTGLVLDRVHDSRRVTVDISPDNELLASWDWNGRPVALTVALRAMSQQQPLATHRYEDEVWITSAWDGRRLILLVNNGQVNVDALDEYGSYNRLGTLAAEYTSPTITRQNGQWLGAIRGDEVVVFEIEDDTIRQTRRLGRHPGASQALFHPRGDFLVTMSPDGDIRMWHPSSLGEPKVLSGPRDTSWVSLMADGSILAAYTRSEEEFGATLWNLAERTPQLMRRYSGGVPVISDRAGTIFDTTNDSGLLLLAAPPEAEPIAYGDTWHTNFHPNGDWLSTTGEKAQLWHLSRPLSIVIARLPTNVFDLEYERHGKFLVAAGMRNHWVRMWPLEGAVPAAPRTLIEGQEYGYFSSAGVSPDGTNLLVTTYGPPLLVPVTGGPARTLEGHNDGPVGVAFSPSGRLAAVPSGGWSGAEPDAIHIWEVTSGRHLEPFLLDSKPQRGFHFLSEDQFLVTTELGVMKYGLDDGTGTLLLEGMFAESAVSGDGRLAVLRSGAIDGCGDEAVILDLETGEAIPLASHGSGICSVDIDEAGTIIVTGNERGEIRIGPVTGEQPHLLVADSGAILAVALDPLGRWIASTGLVSKSQGWSGEATIRLWPMPDLSKPPLHTLPREELIAKLKTLTNLRVVRDEDSPTGWKLSHDPFPGWETVPTW